MIEQIQKNQDQYKSCNILDHMAEGHVRLTVCDLKYRYLSWLSKINTEQIHRSWRRNQYQRNYTFSAAPFLPKTHETISTINQGETTQPLQGIYEPKIHNIDSAYPRGKQINILFKKTNTFWSYLHYLGKGFPARSLRAKLNLHGDDQNEI
jgi:hypothetical protein